MGMLDARCADPVRDGHCYAYFDRDGKQVFDGEYARRVMTRQRHETARPTMPILFRVDDEVIHGTISLFMIELFHAYISGEDGVTMYPWVWTAVVYRDEILLVRHPIEMHRVPGDPEQSENDVLRVEIRTLGFDGTLSLDRRL